MNRHLKSLSRGFVTTALVASLLVVMTGSAIGARQKGVVTVEQPVAHGETTTATVNPGGSRTYVLVQCYTPDGAYVYAAFFGVDADNRATVGPLTSSLWPSGAGDCTAQEGTFAKNGRWQVAASTSFSVQP